MLHAKYFQALPLLAWKKWHNIKTARLAACASRHTTKSASIFIICAICVLIAATQMRQLEPKFDEVKCTPKMA
jgi:hypothetical protein